MSTKQQCCLDSVASCQVAAVAGPNDCRTVTVVRIARTEFMCVHRIETGDSATQLTPSSCARLISCCAAVELAH